MKCAMLATPKKSHLGFHTVQSSFNEIYNKFEDSYYEEEEFQWDDEFSSNSSALSVLLDEKKRVSSPISSSLSESPPGSKIFANSQSTSSKSSISTHSVSQILF